MAYHAAFAGVFVNPTLPRLSSFIGVRSRVEGVDDERAYGALPARGCHMAFTLHMRGG